MRCVAGHWHLISRYEAALPTCAPVKDTACRFNIALANLRKIILRFCTTCLASMGPTNRKKVERKDELKRFALRGMKCLRAVGAAASALPDV